MIDKISIDKDPEKVFILSSIGIEKTNLVKNKETYIETEETIFPIKDLEDFFINNDKVCLKNEDGDIFSISPEQFEIIKEIILGI
jgi:hypothetical protein